MAESRGAVRSVFDTTWYDESMMWDGINSWNPYYWVLLYSVQVQV